MKVPFVAVDHDGVQHIVSSVTDTGGGRLFWINGEARPASKFNIVRGS